MKDVIIFDLDGVIVHTDKYHYQAWKKLADKYGLRFDEEMNNLLRGVSRMASLEIILDKNGVSLSQAEKEEMIAEKNDDYRKLLGNMSPADASDEVVSTLKALKANGFKIAIGSSSKNARFILERIGLIDMFDAISDGNNITHSKPDPEVFNMAAYYLNAPSERCIIVEDAVSGVQAGKSAHMTTVAVGDASAQKVADYNLATFSELLNVVGVK